ncbi:hypothetical protein BI050_gp11 [Pectobacterium phage PP90]|uniref:Uncharacterized protein n=1 Tax=Pectobacterium phage PP90 TaxID=1873959 RepID=A0A1B1PEG5_9CAUD|nr:hypothetical protein BI050_gp11 [Pectobacterium phage PP90]ANT45368.1 hypothetical protein BI050_gp11 [Pectobacterium phage PP90]
MTSLYIGATVLRTQGLYKGMSTGDTATVVSWDAASIVLREYGDGHSHSALQVISTQESWSAVHAGELREIAVQAIANYNQYIKGQPKMYEPMDIK